MTRFKQIKPEKRVEQEVMWWLTRNGFWVNIYDSKATYSKRKSAYTRNPGIVTGHPDLLGLSPDGILVAVELKAPGKLETVTLDQYNFVRRVIDNHGFAAVIDSQSRLQELWDMYKSLHSISLSEASKFLRASLPKRITHSDRLVPAPGQ